MISSALASVIELQKLVIKHQPGHHDQHTHDPYKGSNARPIPADSAEFTGSLYHNTSLIAVSSIMESGLRAGGKIGVGVYDAVYFSTIPGVTAGRSYGAVVRVDVKGIRLASSAGKLMDIQAEVKQELLDAVKAAPSRDERDALRDKAYDSSYTNTEAAMRFTELGYDGYEHGFNVVAITNPELLTPDNLVREKSSIDTMTNLIKRLRSKR